MCKYPVGLGAKRVTTIENPFFVIRILVEPWLKAGKIGDLTPSRNPFMRFITILFLLFTALLSQTIDGVAIMVKNSPITLYEIRQEMELSKATPAQSVDTLIRKKLEQLEAVEKKISVSPTEIQEELERMAKLNHFTVDQLFEAMKTSSGLDKEQAKEKIKENLLGQKLYSSIAFSKMGQPGALEEEEYYQLHLNEFSRPESYEVTTYSSSSREALESKIENPMLNVANIDTKEESLPSKSINPQLVGMLNKIDIGSFGPIFPNGKDKFMSFYMNNKANIIIENIDSVRSQIDNMIMSEKRNQVLNDYFTRLRLSADIQIIRLP
jgi:predicted transcriptional regulator